MRLSLLPSVLLVLAGCADSEEKLQDEALEALVESGSEPVGYAEDHEMLVEELPELTVPDFSRPDLPSMTDSEVRLPPTRSRYAYRSYEDEGEYREPFDERAARRAAERELAYEGYDYSYACTQACSGHEAGWEWRAQNGYSAYGNSQSFAEGGYAFDEALERRVDKMRDDYELGYEADY